MLKSENTLLSLVKALIPLNLGGNWERRLPHAIPAHGIDLLGSPIHHINILDLLRVQGGLAGLVGWGGHTLGAVVVTTGEAEAVAETTGEVVAVV